MLLLAFGSLEFCQRHTDTIVEFVKISRSPEGNSSEENLRLYLSSECDVHMQPLGFLPSISEVCFAVICRLEMLALLGVATSAENSRLFARVAL